MLASGRRGAPHRPTLAKALACRTPPASSTPLAYRKSRRAAERPDRRTISPLLHLPACLPACTQMTVVGYNAAMHAASVLGQPDRALELLEELKVIGSVKHRLLWSCSMLRICWLAKSHTASTRIFVENGGDREPVPGTIRDLVNHWCHYYR